MRRLRLWTTLTCCILALAVYAWAQGRKAGLYDVTSKMTWQQSPFPAGMAPGGSGPRNSQICVSQEQIDKYNGLPPQTRGDCEMSNVVKTANGYSANVSCTGQMPSKGTVEATWDGEGHSHTKVHLTGSMQGKPVEFTNESEATYKGPDCGSVKPIAVK